MSNERYKITTVNKTFFADNLKSDQLKKDTGTFFVREKSSDNWAKVINIKERTGIFEYILSPIFTLSDLCEKLGILGMLLGLIIFMYIYLPLMLLLLLDLVLPNVYVTLSNSKIENLSKKTNHTPHQPVIRLADIVPVVLLVGGLILAVAPVAAAVRRVIQRQARTFRQPIWIMP